MARPTLFSSVKFGLAQRRLNCSAPLLLGHLEFMWSTANESGNPVFQTWEHVEIAAKWDGEPGVFAKILSDSGSNFLDRGEGDCFFIHDYWDHAPDYVRKRFLRERQRMENAKKFQDSDRSLTGQRQTTADNGRPPAPAPTPTPNIKICSELPKAAVAEPLASDGVEPDKTTTPHHEPEAATPIGGSLFIPSESKPFLTHKGPYRVRDEDVHSWFPVRGCKDPRGWPFFHEHGLQLVERFKMDNGDAAYVEQFITAQLPKAVGWLKDRPTRTKTPKGMPAFLATWMESGLNRRQAR